MGCERKLKDLLLKRFNENIVKEYSLIKFENTYINTLILFDFIDILKYLPISMIKCDNFIFAIKNG